MQSTLWKYDQVDQSGGLTYYRIGNDIWVNSNDATIAVGYQNPSGWFQIQNTQIKPVGNVGYDLYNGVEGVKVYLVRKYFGYSNTHTIYDSSIAASVKSFQARRGLPVTGVVNLATWKNMGFSESSWYSLDSYVAPLETNQTSTRSDHIEAMINQAYKYLGQTWISGAASSPQYGVDCSGLVTQALYASGINPAPVSAIQHAQVGNEWNSRMLWSDNRMPKVDFNNRQRGDLIFYTDPSTGLIWHVGILLNRDTMIESWPYAVQVHSIYSGRGNIAGVKRVFA
ncbi:peptidoglycan-binding protein [Companilactobacillus paralimentarius]|uniref:peptidoglycan-binding protein n=1 Tax=Companilactobacillus paralimentarius TaxID=83526 RepID=UPI00384D32BE